MNWKAEVFVEGKWCGNGLVFATEQEAVEYGKDLFSRWYATEDSRAVQTDQPVNYKFENGRAVSA